MSGRLNNVILIDDDRLTNYMNRSLVEKSGIAEDVLIFNDGLDALQHLECVDAMQQRLPEIVMIDINLPGIDGHELIRRIQGLNSFFFPKCMLVYLTNSNSYLDLIKAEKNDVEYFVKKPLDMDRLLELRDEFLSLNSASKVG